MIENVQKKRGRVYFVCNRDSRRHSSGASVSVGLPRVCTVRPAYFARRADAYIMEVSLCEGCSGQSSEIHGRNT